MLLSPPKIYPGAIVDLTRWDFMDSGPLSAEANMFIDQSHLEKMDAKRMTKPLLRYFHFEEPSVTYGYLLDEQEAVKWAKKHGPIPIVKRPTGGGAVFHTPEQLSFSLVFPKGHADFPTHPRALYESIHEKFFHALRPLFSEEQFELHQKNSERCAEPETPAARTRFSECFSEPVCSDLMLNQKKILGGALRVCRNAILYQGALQPPEGP